ncbi:MAG: ABC transporter permease, partial [Nitrososphaeria archaeon]|nr:ABC transporter permease [Nitrososphaeria archaeon]
MDYTEIKSSFRKNKIGLVGLGILASLVIASVITAVTIPVETYKNWNNPASWTELPKSAQPIWVNWFLAKKIPEHQILYSPQTILKQSGSDSIAEQRFHVNYSYDYFPGEFLLNYNTKYSDSPVLQITVIRPDGMSIQLLSSSLPYSQQEVDYSDKVFSTNEIIKKNLRLQSGQFSYSLDNLGAKEIIFADKNSHQVLKGDYEFVVSIYGAKTMDSKLILGGKVYGLSGTDELRRDITIGLL